MDRWLNIYTQKLPHPLPPLLSPLTTPTGLCLGQDVYRLLWMWQKDCCFCINTNTAPYNCICAIVTSQHPICCWIGKWIVKSVISVSWNCTATAAAEPGPGLGPTRQGASTTTTTILTTSFLVEQKLCKVLGATSVPSTLVPVNWVRKRMSLVSACAC